MRLPPRAIHPSARRLNTSFFALLHFRRCSVRGTLQGYHFLDQGQQIALGAVRQRHDLYGSAWTGGLITVDADTITDWTPVPRKNGTSR